MSRWYKCDKKMPQGGYDWYIGYVNGQKGREIYRDCVMQVDCDGERFYDPYTNEDITALVSHWRQLPAAPRKSLLRRIVDLLMFRGGDADEVQGD